MSCQRSLRLRWRCIKCLKANLGKTMLTVCGSIPMYGLTKSKVNPCEVCSFGVKANSVLCVQYGKWIHG